MLQVIEPGGLHLSRQPFPSVHADLDGEREPGLNASIEEAEDRMDLVVIEEKAFAHREYVLQPTDEAKYLSAGVCCSPRWMDMACAHQERTRRTINAEETTQERP